MKLTYGKEGLIAFIERMFRGMSVSSRLDFNYYFTMRNNLKRLDEFVTAGTALKVI